MKLIKLLIPLMSLLLTTFSVQAQNRSELSLIAKGAKLYNENCARCHNPRPAEEYTKKEWSVVMPHMRAKAHMTGKEALAVEAFLASTLTADVRNEKVALSEKVPQRDGKTLIAQFGCQGCHQVKGSGGNLGPTLDGVVKSKGREFVYKKLKNPKFDNAASAMPKFPMSEGDLKTIIDYIKNN